MPGGLQRSLCWRVRRYGRPREITRGSGAQRAAVMVVVPVATVTTINSGHDGEDDDEVSLEHPAA